MVDDAAKRARAVTGRLCRHRDTHHERPRRRSPRAGVDPESLEATIDGRSVTARLVGSEVRISTVGIAPGARRLRLSLADYQETRNMENVARILPNTRVLTARVTVRRR